MWATEVSRRSNASAALSSSAPVDTSRHLLDNANVETNPSIAGMITKGSSGRRPRRGDGGLPLALHGLWVANTVLLGSSVFRLVPGTAPSCAGRAGPDRLP